MLGSSLDELETSLTRLLGRLRDLEEENAGLKHELGELRKSLEELREETRGQADQVKLWGSQRRKIRSQVKQVIQNLAVLEETD